MKHESAIGTSRMVLCIDRIKMLAGGGADVAAQASLGGEKRQGV